jgi:hypothetical protein
MIQRGNLIGIVSIIDIFEIACGFALIFYGAAGILNDDVPQRFIDLPVFGSCSANFDPALRLQP